MMPNTIACCPKRLKAIEPNIKIIKQDTKRDTMACSECTFVCLMHKTTKIALEAKLSRPINLAIMIPSAIPTAVLIVLNPIL